MRLLLDSHVALWALHDPGQLGAECASALIGADEVMVSVVTPWELGIKKALGKLVYPEGLVDALVESGFELLGISAEHATVAPALPPHHRDPFDRMILAQATLEGLLIVTADSQFDVYGVPILNPRQ
jgi:PIN domain nuclease of toxin-antitoxin system